MTHLKKTLLGAALLAVLALPTQAQQTRLSASEDRITDEVIHADLSVYEQVQGRIKAINDGGRPVADYHLSKAQCWLDVSFHEFTRNDRSDFPQAALSESVNLIAGMEQGVSPLPTQTPLVNGAARLREDLWQRLAAINGTPGFTCAQQAMACGEVELVHAGNEFNQQQWRHAKPYIQIAEDWVSNAESAARQCGVVAAPASDAVLTANVLFDFDRSGRSDIRAYSMQSLDRELKRVRDEGFTVASVEVVGHADRLQGRGHDYNQALSQRRAQTVQQLLIERGIAADKISYAYKGDSEQVQQCDGVHSQAALRECLIPNRRVEVRLVVKR